MQKTKRIKQILLLMVITSAITIACMILASFLLESYYRANWGSSAAILHSPPHGTNYPDKLAIVQKWAGITGFMIGLIISLLINKKYSKSDKKL